MKIDTALYIELLQNEIHRLRAKEARNGSTEQKLATVTVNMDKISRELHPDVDKFMETTSGSYERIIKGQP